MALNEKNLPTPVLVHQFQTFFFSDAKFYNEISHKNCVRQGPDGTFNLGNLRK